MINWRNLGTRFFSFLWALCALSKNYFLINLKGNLSKLCIQITSSASFSLATATQGRFSWFFFVRRCYQDPFQFHENRSEFSQYIFSIKVSRTASLNVENSLDICLLFFLWNTINVVWKWLRMQKIAFLRAQIFKIFRGSLPPDPPRSLSIPYSFWCQSSPFSLVGPGCCCCLMMVLSNCNLQNSRFRVQPYFLRARDSETLIYDVENSRLM